MTTRRDFLTTLSVALGTSTLRVPQVHSALPAKKLDRIGIQLYTLRSLTEKDLDATLAKLASIGYKEVEFAGYFGRTPAQIRALLAANRLTSPSTHIPLPASDDVWKKAVDESKQIGHEWIVVPWLDQTLRPNADGWARLADRFNALATVAKAGGMKFAYHNHDFEFQKAAAGTGLDTLISKTDPKLVDFEMDIYWVVKAGANPLDLFARYPRRFPLLHIKDATPAPDLAMVDVGKGSIDFAKIFSQQKASGMSHVFVEHDSPTNAMDSATASYNHLKNLSF